MIRFLLPNLSLSCAPINPCRLNFPGIESFCLGTWGAIAGAAVSVVGGVLTRKKAPEAAPYQNVNLQDQQKQAIAGNAESEQNIETLLNRANSYTQQQAIDLMNKAVPGYTEYAKNLLETGQKKLQNPYALPDDVTANLNRISAERGITRGTAGQTNQYSALRDLGLNMLDYGNQNFQQAMQALTTVTGTAPRISPMSPMSFYVTPAQNAQIAASNNQMNQAIAQGANNANTAAANWNNQNLWDSISKGTGQALPAIIGAMNNSPKSMSPYDGGNPRLAPADPTSPTGGNF